MIVFESSLFLNLRKNREILCIFAGISTNNLKMAFFIIVFLLHTLINTYIFYRGWRAFPKSPYVKILYSIIFFIFYSSFAIMMLGRNIFPLEIQKIFYFLGTTWLAAMVYITGYFLLTDLIFLLNRKFRFLRKEITSRLFHRFQVFSGYAIVFILLLFGHQKFRHPEVVEKDIYIDKPATNYKELKVVGFSDIHLGVTVDKEKLKGYVRLINKQKPDIIIIAGDMVDNNVFPLMEEKMYEEINDLQAPLGVYFCLGNHEYLSGINESLEFFNQTTKMTILKDQAIHIDDSFWIIGRDDKHNPDRKELKELTAKTNPNQPLFLLDHQPYHLEQAEENGIDLQFSGHTHHGQLWPFNYIVDMIYEVGHGYKKKGNTHIYVSSGLALWGPEYRIGTQSELVVFNVKFK